MTHSYASKEDALMAGLAQGHSKLFGFPIPRRPVFRANMLGANYIVSTARDLSRFLMALDNEGQYKGARILSPASVALMATPAATVSNSTYGLGWTVRTYRGEIVEGHGGADEVFTTQTALLPNLHRGYVLLMNQQHLIEGMFASGQLETGMLDLLLGHQPGSGGASMKLIGLLLLAVFIASMVTIMRSFIRMHGWSYEARNLILWQIARRIAPHVIMPVIILIVLYRYLGSLFLGEPRAWNFSSVGAYFMPDIALLVLLSFVPDLLQALYMIIVAIMVRTRKAVMRF